MATSYVALFTLLMFILLGVGVMAAAEARVCREVRADVLIAGVAAVAAILDISRRTVGEWSKARLLARVCRRVDAVQVDVLVERLLE